MKPSRRLTDERDSNSRHSFGGRYLACAWAEPTARRAHRDGSEPLPQFFNLRTGFAGEMLQKFVNYRAKLAIVVADPQAHGERFAELVYEHQAHPHVRFFTSEADARSWLDGN